MKLTQTKDYLLLIDEEAEIKEGWKGYAYKEDVADEVFKHFYTENSWYDDAKIVIAYHPLTKEAKELDLPLLPPFPVVSKIDIQGMAIEKYGDNYWSVDKLTAFEEGYKAAQTKLFSLEDMKKAVQRGIEIYKESISGEYSHSELTRNDLKEKYIQSLSTQQLPKEFIPEYEYQLPDGTWHLLLNTRKESVDKHNLPIRTKTITNSEGKEELVGIYKY